MSQYFPKPYESFGGDINGKMNLSNYVAKADLRNATGVDTSKFAKKVDLASLKSNVDELDIDKLENVSADLTNIKNKVNKLDTDKLAPILADFSKLSNEIKNDVIKKDVYNAKIQNIKDKIPDITNLGTRTTLNAKMNEGKRKVPSITNLATIVDLTAVENKIPNVSNLVKKPTIIQKLMKLKKKITDHNHDKYITPPKFIKLTAEHSAQTNLATKSDIANFVNKTDLMIS